jgi:signal transduction histidine kinase
MITRPWSRLGSRWWHGYALAVLGVFVCSVARELLQPLLGQQALLLPYVIAVLPSAWIGGLGAGLAATLLSVAAAVGFFIRPAPPSDWIDTDTHIALFAVEATLIVALTVAIRRAHDTAAAHSAAKDALLATVSHDLGTPLNVVTGWAAQLLARPDDAGLVRRAAAAIQRAVQAQRTLVDDLLDVSRATANKLTIAREAVDLNALLEDAVDGVRAAAAQKRLTLEVKCTAPIAPVLGDPTRLQQVFGNLLANAVKFTPANGTVAIAAGSVAGGVCVEVTDTGLGIPRDQLSKVFEPFHQVHRKRDMEAGGLGIGLAIARRIVQLHGGTISVDSAGANRGSTFVVMLPAVGKDETVQPSVS